MPNNFYITVTVSEMFCSYPLPTHTHAHTHACAHTRTHTCTCHTSCLVVLVYMLCSACICGKSDVSHHFSCILSHADWISSVHPSSFYASYRSKIYLLTSVTYLLIHCTLSWWGLPHTVVCAMHVLCSQTGRNTDSGHVTREATFPGIDR